MAPMRTMASWRWLLELRGQDKHSAISAREMKQCVSCPRNSMLARGSAFASNRLSAFGRETAPAVAGRQASEYTQLPSLEAAPWRLSNCRRRILESSKDARKRLKRSFAAIASRSFPVPFISIASASWRAILSSPSAIWRRSIAIASSSDQPLISRPPRRSVMANCLRENARYWLH
jgi:hypothetical protein